MPDETFEPLGHDDGQGTGPPTVLLCGFTAQEEPAMAALLARVDAPHHRVLRCSQEMVAQTLGEALASPNPGPPVPAEALPRVVILSGLSGRQLHGVIDGFAEAGLPRPIWASVTPHNLGLRVRDLLRELLAEARALASQHPPKAPTGGD